MKKKVYLILVVFCLAIIGLALNLGSRTVYAEGPMQEVNAESDDYVAPGADGRVNLLGNIPYTITNEHYIPNWNYFYSNPKHAENTTDDNPIGTCTTVAMQMLVGYHNYYSDRRLIPEFSEKGERYLSQDYGNMISHPSISCGYAYGLGSDRIGTEDAVFYGIFDSSWFSGWPLGQTIGDVTNSANKFIKKVSPIADSVNLYEDPYTKENAKAELDAGNPIILGFKPILGGESQDSFHVTVAYGYAELDGIFGFIVHYGWYDDSRYIWVPATWVGYEVKMNINHVHSFEETDEIINNLYKVYKCSDCGYKKAEHIYELEGSKIIGLKSSPPKDISFPIIVLEPIKPKEDLNIYLNAIGEYAFAGCNTLESFTASYNYPYSIGEGAFYNCKSLTTVSFNDSNSIKKISKKLFYGCNRLQSINIPRHVEEIGESAFAGCSSLKSLTIPAGVKNIGNYILKDCSNLQTIDFNCVSYDRVGNYLGFASIGSDNLTINFNGNVPSFILYENNEVKNITLSSNVKNIGEYAFSYCTGLTTVTIPNSMQSIGDYAFKGCKNLTEIHIGFDFGTENNYNNFDENALPFAEIGNESVKAYFTCEVIPDYIFRKFQGEVYIGENVKTIGSNSFYECDMTSIYISSGVESIDIGPFGKCNNLVEITVSPDNPIYKSENNCLIRKAKNVLWMACKTSVIPSYVDIIAEYAYRELDITTLTIPNTVTYIDGYALYGCTKLQNISLPIGEEKPAWYTFYGLLGESGGNPGMTVNITNGTVIHEEAFMYCDKIQTIILPDTIEVFENNAFSFCSSLRKINTPNSLQKIDCAFLLCRSLKAFKVPSTVTLITDNSFAECTNLQLIELQRTAAQGITVIEEGAFGNWQQDYRKPRAIVVNDMDSYDAYVAQFENNNEPQLVDLVTYRELRYTLLDNNSYSVSRGRAYLNGTIEIPANYEGLPVTTIGQNAFKDCEFITEIKIPATVTEIKSGAFDECISLRTIQIFRHSSLGLVNIAEDNFTYLHVVVLPDSTTCAVYKSHYTQYADIFTYFGDELNYVLKSDGTYKITGGAAGDSEELFIPAYYNGKPVTEIADEAFMNGNFSVVAFMGGCNITTIGEKAFYGANFESFNGITIPISVQNIGKQAFANSSILSITLRSYVNVDQGAFDTDVTIYTDAVSEPESWSFVNGHYIFYNCGLSEVGNYVETFCVQRKNSTDEINVPYRQLHFGFECSSNQAVPYFINQYNELQAYSFDEIMGGAFPIGRRIYAVYYFISLL